MLGRRKAETAEKLKAAIEASSTIDYSAKRDYTVAEWLEIWLEDYAKLNLRSSTYKTYRGFLSNHITPRIGRIPLERGDTAALQRAAGKGKSTKQGEPM